MPACPVCESPSTGRTCEVCGKELAAPPPLDLPATRLLGLEPGAAEDRGLALPVAPLQDVERTRFEADVAGPAEPPVGWESTRAAPVDVDVAASGLEELESGRADPVGGPSPDPAAGVRTCRYCRRVQAEGLLCDGCGMRLPRLLTARAPQRPVQAEALGLARCRRCGEKNHGAARCGSCGAPFSAAD